MSVIDTRIANRAERRKQQTRALLLQAATELLWERGYVRLTLQAIAERADVGYGTFYLHFKDKDDIIWAVLKAIYIAWEQDLQKSLENVPYPRREYLSWVAIFRYTRQVHQSFLEVFGNSAVLSERYQDLMAQSHRYNLEHGIYRAPIELPLDYFVEFATGALWRLLFWYARQPDLYTPEAMATMLFKTIFRQPPPVD